VRQLQADREQDARAVIAQGAFEQVEQLVVADLGELAALRVRISTSRSACSKNSPISPMNSPRLM
jgi:hypothetical protein